MTAYDYDKGYIAIQDELNELDGFIDNLCLLNLNEASMKLDGDLGDELEMEIINKRSDYMIDCIKSLDKIKTLIKELK
mgnify:FL=1|jgi:hypothetical protein|tara:strand:+ start:10723 stop:10956 length:234 start_codon:yes stop_codon:yes gene_type:complete